MDGRERAPPEEHKAEERWRKRQAEDSGRQREKTWVDKWAFGFFDRGSSTKWLLKHLNNRILHGKKKIELQWHTDITKVGDKEF